MDWYVVGAAGGDGNKEDAIVYDDEAVRQLLDRSQEGIEEKNKLLDDYLSSFKVASYIVKEVQQEEEEEVSWSLLLLVTISLITKQFFRETTTLKWLSKNSYQT